VVTEPAGANHGAEGRTAFRLVSYNIRRGHGLFRRYAPERTLATLREIGADAVALQEVDSGLLRDSRGQLEWLARELDMTPVPGYCRPARSGGRYGNALLLRRPPLSVRCHDLSVSGREPRAALEAMVEFGAASITILVTHFGLRRFERREQARLLAAALASIDGPLIVAGDFNEWRRRPAPDALDEFFDAADTGLPPTFPALRPFLALDRIRVRPASLLASLSAHLSRAARLASDHLPLVAEIRL